MWDWWAAHIWFDVPVGQSLSRCFSVGLIELDSSIHPFFSKMDISFHTKYSLLTSYCLCYSCRFKKFCKRQLIIFATRLLFDWIAVQLIVTDTYILFWLGLMHWLQQLVVGKHLKGNLLVSPNRKAPPWVSNNFQLLMHIHCIVLRSTIHSNL